MVMSGGTVSDFRFCRCRVAGVYMLFHHQCNGLISVKNSAYSTNAFWSHQNLCCHSNVYWYYNTLQIQLDCSLVGRNDLCWPIYDHRMPSHFDVHHLLHTIRQPLVWLVV
jgi:hypothetical protein